MRIPIIEATEPLPVISPEGAGRGWKAIGAAAGEAQNLANTISKQRAEVNEKKRILAMNSDLAFAETDILKSDTLFTTESRKGADPKTYLPIWEKAWNEKVKEKLNTVKDPETKARLEISLKRKGMERYEEESKFADGLFVNTEKAKDIPILEDYAARGKLEEGLRYIEGRKDIYKPTEIEALRGKFKEDFQRSDLIGYVDSQSPELIEEGIKKIDKNEYPSLSRTELAQRRTNALDRIARLKKEGETKAEELAIDNAIRKVKKEWPGNPDVQNLFLANSDWQEKNGLTTKTAHIAQGRIKAEQDLVEAGVKKIQEDTSKQAYGLLANGTLTKKWIDDKVSEGKLSPEKGEHWNKELLNPPDAKTDPQEYFDIVKAMETKTKGQVENMILKSKKLSRETKISLGNEVYKVEDKINGGWVKLAEDEIKSMVLIKRSILAPIQSSQSELTDYGKAREAFKAALEKAEKSGKPLQGQEIVIKAREIAKGFQKSTSTRMLEMYREMGRTSEELKRAGDIKKRADKYKTIEDLRKDVASKKIDDVLALEIIRYNGWGD